MAIEKKHGRGRLDKWYKLAKEKGYRARAAFKLIQLNKRYRFLEQSRVVIDLCCAPGSWCQVAAELMPPSSLLIGVDLAPVKPIPRAVTIQSDITTDSCRSAIRSHLKNWQADTILHDGAPNVGVAWVQDAFSQAELVLQAVKLASTFLVPGGTFVTKIFRSKDFYALMYVLESLFTRISTTKPPASRVVSAEVFVVCQGYKAPPKLDPRFLDPRAVFADLNTSKPNNAAKVFDPEKKSRKREGYDESGLVQFRQAPASDFIESNDPVAMLGSLNKLSFKQSSDENLTLAALDKLPATTAEIRHCCADLKVLGRKDFRNLLRWRIILRGLLGFNEQGLISEESQVEISKLPALDEESQTKEELQLLSHGSLRKRKKRDKKEKERRQRELKRLQMHMPSSMEIGMEPDAPPGADSLFQIASVNKAPTRGAELVGDASLRGDVKDQSLVDRDTGSQSEDELEPSMDLLDRELETLYQQYIGRRSNDRSGNKIKTVVEEYDRGEWSGFSSLSARFSSSDGSEEELEQEIVAESRPSHTFFDQQIFREVNDTKKTLGNISNAPKSNTSTQTSPNAHFINRSRFESAESPQHQVHRLKMEERGSPKQATQCSKVRSKPESQPSTSATSTGKDAPESPDINIITTEAMTLAQQIASGSRAKHDVIDDSFNKFSFYDSAGLPDWFLDDEKKHSKVQKPITAEAAKAIREKLRALNARPIKKVQEAKNRKKQRATRRLEKLRQKSDVLADGDSMTEQDKAKSIAKLMSRASKSKPRARAKLVVAKGGNRGISGRPRGVKGRYKIVDARLKKDVRAARRKASSR